MLVLLNNLLVVEVKKCFPVVMFSGLFLGNIETYRQKFKILGQRLQKIAPAINLFIQILIAIPLMLLLFTTKHKSVTIDLTKNTGR